MSEGIIAVKNTARKYLKGASDQTIRERFLLAHMNNHGRIKTGEGGVDTYWNVKARQPEVRQNGDASQQTFSEHDAYEQLNIDVRGYVATDRLTLKKQLMNKNPLAIVDLYSTKIEDLLKSVQDQFNGEFYIDGNASGNENRILGLESFMGYDTDQVVAADLVAEPEDTYAEKSTVPGALGGSWSTDRGTSPNAHMAVDWPYGSGDAEFDYLSPKLINYSSTSWPSGEADWRSNCAAVMRRAKTWCRVLGGSEKVPMCHLLSSELYDDFMDYQETKFRTITPHKEGEDLGFPEVLAFEGAAVKFDFDVPAETGYGINAGEMLLFSIHDDLFYSHGPEWDLESLSYLFLIGFFGNMRCNPKHFAKYASYA